jgi:hypothetical protein
MGISTAQEGATAAVILTESRAALAAGALQIAGSAQRRIRLEPESHGRVEARDGTITAPRIEAERHEGQRFPPDVGALLSLPATAEFPRVTEAPLFPLSERYRRFRIAVEDGPADDVPSTIVYLFNVVVALEWAPGPERLAQIMRGLREASDFLYDATNGAMAFGQVVLAGPELMATADIQIMASNRFHPRSSVNGLNEVKKFSPIRLGRGSWHKNNGALLTWDEAAVYPAIAHEWAHYALSLRDEYVDEARRVARRGRRLRADAAGSRVLVVPRIRHTIETLMATLDASELVPLQRRPGLDDELRAQLRNQFDRYYPNVEQALFAANPGPRRFPAALPQFYTLAGSPIGAPEGLQGPLRPTQERTIDVDGLDIGHCWLYALKHLEGDGLHLVAQGTLEASSAASTIEVEGRLSHEGPLQVPGDGFTVLGADPSYTVVAVGASQEGAGLVRLRELGEGDDEPWQRRELPAPPVVAVLPEPGARGWPEGPGDKAAPLRVRALLSGENLPDQLWIVEPGAPYASLYAQRSGARLASQEEAPAQYRPIAQLDGAVVLRWGDEAEPSYWVAEYSHGGNPPTSVRSPGAPISAGSSDGNLMIFSRTAEARAADPAYDPAQDPDYDLRIVTTRNYAGFQDGAPGAPRSYLFSVAANLPLDYGRLRPTLVLAYDAEALDDDHDLLICRYDVGSREWLPLPTYLPAGAFYAAAAIDGESAPNLTAQYPPGNIRVEYYRLYAVDRQAPFPV